MRTRSARSSSASFPVLSTFTRAPKILILSVSIAVLSLSLVITYTSKVHEYSQVFAMRILAFSSRLGQLMPMVLSRMKPEGDT